MDNKDIAETSALTESTSNPRTKRRSSSRRASFNPRQSLASCEIFCGSPAALKIYKNMREAMKGRFEAAKKLISEAESELGLESNKQLAELYRQMKSLELSFGTEGDVLEEELLFILADLTNRADEPLEQNPFKKARLDNQPPGCLISPVTEIAKRLDEWSTSDGVQEIQRQITLDPLEGLHKTVSADSGKNTLLHTGPDTFEREQALIQKAKSDNAKLAAEQKETLLKRRTQRLNALPSHVITVERLAKFLAGTVM
ncbi:uncharacterized protein LOC111244691 isoform X1 [Varroa destructor]|uniref:Uncharacterized protein n=1 Tax=Varroa destructor TaxID=109461 RepID=A0A7M7M4B1_VARDE|nr:uncharacterized protein LOC111244691 isoform X1 [Varroa destructor]